MAWKKPSPELGAILEHSLEGKDVYNRPMFGCPAWFVAENRQWFAGVHEDRLLVRLSQEDQERLRESHPQASRFEPMPGRVMKEFVVLPADLLASGDEFKQWLEVAYDYSRSLPAKPPAKPRKGPVRAKGKKI